MNRWRIGMIAVLTLVLTVPFAEAKGSPSFKGGFSSYKSAPKTSYKSSPAPKNGFGSFQKDSANGASTASGASADLSQSAAKQNAWNSYQSTQQKKWADTNKPNGNWGSNGSGNNGNGAGWSRSDYGQNNRGGSNGGSSNGGSSNGGWNQPSVHHTTINHNSGGGFMHGLMWFMIGQSWGNHHNTVVVQQPQNSYGNDTSVQASDWNAAEPMAAPINEPVKEKESAVWGVLRLLLWVGFLWAIIVVIKKVIAVKNFVQNKRYSLRSF